MFHFHVSHRTFWSWLLRMVTIFIGIYVGAYFFVPLILSAKTECLDISQNLIYLGSIYLHLKVAPSNISFYTCDWSFLDRICWSSLYLKMQHSSLERDRNGCIFAALRPCIHRSTRDLRTQALWSWPSTQHDTHHIFHFPFLPLLFRHLCSFLFFLVIHRIGQLLRPFEFSWLTSFHWRWSEWNL